MNIGYLGLGKMGKGMVVLMKEKGHDVVAWNRSEEPRKEAQAEGIKTADSVAEVVKMLPDHKVIWLMVTQNAVDEIITELVPMLKAEDIIIDGGNSFYKDSIRRGESLKEHGIHFMDVGTSGGPAGARHGACLMIGGDKETYQTLEPLFKDLAAGDAYQLVGPVGAGHFVKMVHNGIEYGMMQALAEGFAVLKESPFKLDLESVAKIYNSKSVIESRLTEWLLTGFEKYGQDLKDVSSTVAHTGEGKWTVEAAHEFGVPAPIIEGSYQWRVDSEKNPSYIGKVLSMLRNQFGGHDITHS